MNHAPSCAPAPGPLGVKNPARPTGVIRVRTLCRAMAYFRKDLHLIGALVLLIGCSVALGLLAAWPLAVLADTVLNQNPQTAWSHRILLAPFPESKIAQILGMAVLGLIIKVLLDTVWMGRMMLNNRLKYNGTSRVRSELYAKLQALGMDFHKNQPQGDTIYRVTTDALGPFGVVDTFIGSSVAIISLVAMTCVMLSRSVPLTLGALSVTPVLALVNVYFGRRIKHTSLRAKQADADLTTMVQRNTSVMALIQAFRRQTREQARFDGAVAHSVKENWRFNWQENLYPLAVQATFAVGAAIIFGYGGYLVYRDTMVQPVVDPITVGTLIVFMDYLTRLWDPLQWVTGFIAKVQSHVASSERVFCVLDTPVHVKDKPGARYLPLGPRTLVLDDVRFSYRHGEPVLHGIQARVPFGHLVAFVGPSGAGKSTLLNLLVRYHDPSGGAIRLDGHDMRDIRLADLRAHVALVSQDCMLLPGTIAENIAYGRPDATREQVQAAAELSGAAEFVELLPDGYETRIHEGASNLSGGQRQRLAIARALLTEAPILVLDEPTSALDPRHEAMVVQTLHRLKRHRTVIVVTHRLASTASCDQIFVLDGGGVVEHGTHDVLVKRGGMYASMLRVTERLENASVVAA